MLTAVVPRSEKSRSAASTMRSRVGTVVVALDAALIAAELT